MKRIISSTGPGKRSTTANRQRKRSRVVPARAKSLDGRAVPKGAARDLLIASVEALLARFDSLSAKLHSLEAYLRAQNPDPQ